MIILDVFIIMVFSQAWVISGFFVFQIVKLNRRGNAASDDRND